jgi:hypothetical protein
MRKNIYVTFEDKELLKKLNKRLKKTDSELYRMGLVALRGEPTIDSILEELGVQRFDMCPTHSGSMYNTCWNKHI